MMLDRANEMTLLLPSLAVQIICGDIQRRGNPSITMDSSIVGGYAVADSWGSLSTKLVLHSEVIQQRIFGNHSSPVMRPGVS
jgi:hypothetical protein